MISIPKKYFLLLFSFFVSVFFSIHAVLAKTVVIHGKIVYPEGYSQKRYLVIESGIIQAIQEKEPNVAKDSEFIYTNGYIFPGLIDLHTHLTYNILPLWENAQGQFQNRFEWRDDPSYKEKIRAPYRAISCKETDPQFYKGLLLFDELQAISGGTTLIQESQELDKETQELSKRMVVRGTDYPEDLELENEKRIISVIDLFEKRVKQPPKPKPALNRFASMREKNEIQAFIPHLAEGRTGFLRDHPYDDYSRKEFEAFMSHELFSDPKNSPKPPVALIHASGMDPNNDDHIGFLKRWNMGIVWSPTSNLLLYGDTLDVETLLKNKIRIALGSDWSPSGSKHVLDEARLAKFYLNTIGAEISDEEIFKMTTLNPAQMIGHPKLGAIESGYLADLFILDDPFPTLDPLESFFKTNVEYISLVMIRGKAVYGNKAIVSRFETELQYLPERERREIPAVAEKVIYVDPQIGLIINDVVERIEDYLKESFQMKRSNTLSTTDVPYRERLIEIQKFIVDTFSN